jgi:hypothetical protein
VPHHGVQRGGVEEVRREDDAGGPLGVRCGAEAGSQGPFDFAAGHRVHHHARLAHQAQQVGVGVGLLGVADGVEGPQLGDALADGGGVIHPQRRAMGARQGAEQIGGERIHAAMMRRFCHTEKYFFFNLRFKADMD